MTLHDGWECVADRYLPTLESRLKTESGERGWLCTFFNLDERGEPTIKVADFVLNDTRVKLNDFLPKGLGEDWIIKLKGIMTAEKDMPFEFGLAVAGAVRRPELLPFTDIIF